MAIKLVLHDLDDPDKVRVSGVGFDLKLATDEDLKHFGHRQHYDYDPRLWEICKYIWGRPPNDAWMGEPTGDQFRGHAYSENAWPVARVKREFVSAKIISMSTQPEIVSAVRHDNTENSNEAVFKSAVSRTVSDMVERTQSQHVTVGYALTVGVEVGSEAAGVKSKVESTFSFEAGMEWSQTESHTRELGASIETEVTIPAGEAKRSVLYAAFGTCQIEVEYDMTLDGEAYFFYHKPIPRQGHHCHTSIAEVRRVGREAYDYDMPASVRCTEQVKIGCFGDSYSRLEDVE